MNNAVLLVNLGSPDSTAVGDVRRYLNEFLMDRRVIDVPWPLRRFIVGMILLTRPAQSAHAYQSIWTPEGSPLIVTSHHVRDKLQERFTVPVELAMRYQHPSIADALRRLVAQKVDRTLLIPLFPHYAMSSYETAVVRAQQVARRMAPRMEIVVQPPYGDTPDYIAALTASARNHLEAGYDHLLFSFHGVPERHLRRSDPTGKHCLAAPNCCETASPAHATCYRAQCFKTVTAFVQAAGIPTEKFSVSFQSRLGRDPWLKPYTDLVLAELPKRKVKRLLVICPAFVADCLETLEEIGIRGRKTFLEAGGEDFAQIPCLNEHPLWIAALERMVRAFVGSPLPA
jgi:protoporphyrin/coproporphyrin ferrochelatase